MKNYIVMTVKGRKDLTVSCLVGLATTDSAKSAEKLVLVDAGFGEEGLGLTSKDYAFIDYLHRINCNIPEGWNIGIRHLLDIERAVPNESAVWLLNNDIRIRRAGWIEALHNRLEIPGTGVVGSTAMSVFGHGFATGGVWGFRLDAALEIAENGKILDERFHYSCQDVDLSIRMAKAGYTVTHVPGVEYGEDPMLVHAESQTMFSIERKEDVLKKRKDEFKLLIDKHGRRDGVEGYDGL